MDSFYMLVNKSHTLPADFVPKELVRPNIPFGQEDNGSNLPIPQRITVPNISFPPEQGRSTPDTPPGQEKFLMDRTAAACLELLFDRGRGQNIHLYGVSGYRSYSRQQEIYEESVQTKGAEHAARYIAPPGASEHQSGLAMDISIPTLNFQLEERFDTTKEGKWLKQFAPLYGFIIRYPRGVSEITGYAYEPWHIRFVTKPLAIYLSKTHLTLEEYHSFSL